MQRIAFIAAICLASGAQGSAIIALEPGRGPAAYPVAISSQAIAFDADGTIRGTCSFRTLRPVSLRPFRYGFASYSCNWDRDGARIAISGPSSYLSSYPPPPPLSRILAGPNAAGIAVGFRYLSPSSSPYVAWADVQAILQDADGVELDVTDPAWELRYATDIHEDGAFVGIGRLNGFERGFLLVP